jgi:hypothetical protein
VPGREDDSRVGPPTAAGRRRAQAQPHSPPEELSACAQLISQGTPKRSMRTPKPADQNVFWNGKRISPPSDSEIKICFALASSEIVSVTKNPRYLP